MINPMALSGRRILVTGASSGIGREAANLLAQLGARLTISGRDTTRLAEVLEGLEGSDHQVSAFDMTSTDEIPDWIRSLVTSQGSFNGIVHCAGVHSARPLRMMNLATLDSVLRVNLHSAAMLAKGFRQKGCHTPGDGSIVFIGSVAGIVGEAGIPAYSASKAALIGLTRSLAIELAPDGIRVNAVAAGLVKTEMTERLRQTLTPEQFAAIEQKHPIGIGLARDVANGIAFLLADTSRWITGISLVIDGGYTAQ